jgi:glycosyltransferase involved in cell wall biosynthesis
LPADKPRLGVLIAQHPAINHAMLLREVRELRQPFDVYTASIRDPDRPPERLTAEEKDEAARTYFVKRHRVGGALQAHLRTLLSRPGSYFGGFFYAMRLAGSHPVRAFLYFGYFTQALMIGQWMARNRIAHLHVHYSSTVGLLVQRIFPVALSISFHGPDEFNDPASFHIREKVQASAFVRAISQYARSQLMKSSDTADWHKIEVVYMGVDPAAFSPRPFRPDPSPLNLICVGRLAPVKAQHILLAAVERLVRNNVNVRLHIAGGGPDRKSLEAGAAARHIQDHVVFHGFTLQEKLDELYRNTDIFVLASFAEGVPGVLMEAMSMEIPCVSTWITGVPELIRNGIDGLLVAPSDDEAFAAAVAQLAADRDLRLRIGQAARARILDRFLLEKNAAQLAGILRRTLERTLK